MDGLAVRLFIRCTIINYPVTQVFFHVRSSVILCVKKNRTFPVYSNITMKNNTDTRRQILNIIRTIVG